MSTPENVTIIYASDWMGVYFDEDLAAEGHNINIHDLLDMLQIEYKAKEADWKWIEKVQRMPLKLSDVKLEEE